MEVIKYLNINSTLNLVFIAGGPGLSTDSFKELLPLKDKYSLFFLSPMGTTTPLVKKPTYSNLITEIKSEIEKLENVILCGHSFGGIQAIDIASLDLDNIKGLIAIGSPVSKNAFSILNTNFDKEVHHKEISNKFESEPTDQAYKDWFFAYRNFYFNPSQSDELISIITNDSVCVESYSEAIVESATKSDLLNKINEINIPKLFISGSIDKVMPPISAKHEADTGGFELKIIEDAGHFVHFERPKETISIIDEFLSIRGETNED
jgi:pimeloyl-ACP methyl ester carboxylesterase